MGKKLDYWTELVCDPSLELPQVRYGRTCLTFEGEEVLYTSLGVSFFFSWSIILCGFDNELAKILKILVDKDQRNVRRVHTYIHIHMKIERHRHIHANTFTKILIKTTNKNTHAHNTHTHTRGRSKVNDRE